MDLAVAVHSLADYSFGMVLVWHPADKLVALIPHHVHQTEHH